MKYKYIKHRTKRKMHLCGDNNMTLCKVENGTDKLDVLTDTPDPNRKVCNMCLRLHERGMKKPRGTKKVDHKYKKYRDPFLHSVEWRRVRYQALEVGRGVCECCGRSPKEGAILNVDHIKPRKTHPELALTVSNLQVLCSWCNQGKGSEFDTDWREPRLSVLMGEKVNV